MKDLRQYVGHQEENRYKEPFSTQYANYEMLCFRIALIVPVVGMNLLDSQVEVKMRTKRLRAARCPEKSNVIIG